LWQCAPKARIISGGKNPPGELSIDAIGTFRPNADAALRLQLVEADVTLPVTSLLLTVQLETPCQLLKRVRYHVLRVLLYLAIKVRVIVSVDATLE
jgi:hypothetical protein